MFPGKNTIIWEIAGFVGISIQDVLKYTEVDKIFIWPNVRYKLGYYYITTFAMNQDKLSA